jgi:hypothetical protein
MYHRHPAHVAFIAIACSGPTEGEIRSSPAGIRHSKDGADLNFTTADAMFFIDKMCTHSSDGHDAPDEEYVKFTKMPGRCAQLTDPSVGEFEEALRLASEYVSQYVGTRHWSGGGISLCYSGHGAETTGALVLKDGDLTGAQLAEMIAANVEEGSHGRGVELLLDSCFAGAFMADFLAASCSPDMQDKIHPREMWIASLHDELAWELPELSHGALVFTLKNPGNAHADHWKLGEAVHNRDEQYVRMALQGFVPNPVTYLTEGEQHSINLINGHHLEVKGAGYFELPPFESFDSTQLIDALERARDAGHSEVQFFA